MTFIDGCAAASSSSSRGVSSGDALSTTIASRFGHSVRAKRLASDSRVRSARPVRHHDDGDARERGRDFRERSAEAAVVAEVGGGDEASAVSTAAPRFRRPRRRPPGSRARAETSGLGEVGAGLDDHGARAGAGVAQPRVESALATGDCDDAVSGRGQPRDRGVRGGDRRGIAGASQPQETVTALVRDRPRALRGVDRGVRPGPVGRRFSEERPQRLLRGVRDRPAAPPVEVRGAPELAV
jgi:hypothetical protein